MKHVSRGPHIDAERRLIRTVLVLGSLGGVATWAVTFAAGGTIGVYVLLAIWPALASATTIASGATSNSVRSIWRSAASAVTSRYHTTAPHSAPSADRSGDAVISSAIP